MTGSRETLGVVVLGMHRSGTSAAARLINLMGFSLGPEDELLPPQVDNPAGFWENAALVALNDEILLALGGDWSSPPRLDDAWEAQPELDALRPRAAAVAASVLSAPRWVWKDPRVCVTLPFWLPILGRDIAIVLVHRNPLEVAASLQARDGFPVSLGLALWERYVRSALAASAGRPVCITRYEELVADPVAWCRRVGDFLRALGADAVPIDVDDVRAAVRPDLRHVALPAASLSTDPAVSPELRAVATMLDASRATHATFAPPALPPETPWVDVLLEERRRLRRCAWELDGATARIAAIESSRSYRWLAPLRALYELLATPRR